MNFPSQFFLFHAMIKRMLTIGGMNLSDKQKNRIPVEIYGQNYMIVGTESPEHIRKVAELVDEK